MVPTLIPGRSSGRFDWCCPECDSGLANCQGPLPCTDCEWIERG